MLGAGSMQRQWDNQGHAVKSRGANEQAWQANMGPRLCDASASQELCSHALHAGPALQALIAQE